MTFRGVEKEVVGQAADAEGDDDAARQRAFGLEPQAGAPEGEREQGHKHRQAADAELGGDEKIFVVRMLVGAVMEERMIIDRRRVKGLAPSAGAYAKYRVTLH